MVDEQAFRDEITADFHAGKLGIDNGWLFEHVEVPAGHSCTPYGCPPSCSTAPIMDLWVASQAQAVRIQHAWDPRTEYRDAWCGDPNAERWTPQNDEEAAMPTCSKCHKAAMHYRAELQDVAQRMLRQAELKLKECGIPWYPAEVEERVRAERKVNRSEMSINRAVDFTEGHIIGATIMTSRGPVWVPIYTPIGEDVDANGCD